MVPLVRDVSYVPCVQGRSWSRPKHTFKLPHLLVLWPVSQIRYKVQHIAVLQLLCDFTYNMCQRVVTGDRALRLLFRYLFSVPLQTNQRGQTSSTQFLSLLRLARVTRPDTRPDTGESHPYQLTTMER